MHLSARCIGSAVLFLHGNVLATAQQSPLLQHAPNRHNVTAALFTELEELARIVDISYCVGLGGIGINKPFTCLSRCSNFAQFELVTTWNTGPLLSDSCGYIALDHEKKRIIVAFRGTYSIANTVVDLSTVPQKYVPYPGSDDDGVEAPRCRNCTVHMGFHTSWLNTRSTILPFLTANLASNPTYTLHLVGHSLGGAIAALAGLDFLSRDWNPVVTTFGEPRIGNSGLAEYLDERFNLSSSPSNPTSAPALAEHLSFRRVTHVSDPVPLLPLTEWGYAMHAGEIHISKSALSPEPSDLRVCEGDADPECIAGQDSSLVTAESPMRKRGPDPSSWWGVPSRYRLWELFFSHRDYFWRLGLCVPGGDPLGGGGGYDLPPLLAAQSGTVQVGRMDR